jgi:hypothetical protein
MLTGNPCSTAARAAILLAPLSLLLTALGLAALLAPTLFVALDGRLSLATL